MLGQKLQEQPQIQDSNNPNQGIGGVINLRVGLADIRVRRRAGDIGESRTATFLDWTIKDLERC